MAARRQLTAIASSVLPGNSQAGWAAAFGVVAVQLAIVMGSFGAPVEAGGPDVRSEAGGGDCLQRLEGNSVHVRPCHQSSGRA